LRSQSEVSEKAASPLDEKLVACLEEIQQLVLPKENKSRPDNTTTNKRRINGAIKRTPKENS
jgi:hypothetical protein